MADNKSIPLNNGKKMPVIGLGLWKMPDGSKAEQVISWALEAGYRLFDTATIYGNERELGNALRKSGINRKELFVTTKVWNDEQGYKRTLKAFDNSLSDLQMDYVDLYLIHWPVSNKNIRMETWQALEEIYSSGKATSIGVSNYTIELLEEMKGYAKVPPAVDQVELHPFWSRMELMDYCHKNNMAVEDYCPLVRGRKLDDKRISLIATKHHKTNAQVVLRWAIQHGNVVIPKSSRLERLKENITIFDFELSGDDMAMLDSMNENYRVVTS